MGLSFVLYLVPLTFEYSKLWPLQPLQPLKPPFFQRDEKYEILEDFFFRGDEKNNTKTGKEFGID